jgi:hypothetical protein
MHMKKIAYIVAGILAIAGIGSLMGLKSGEARTLTDEQRHAALTALDARHLSAPVALDVAASGFVTADFEVSETAADGLGRVGLRKIGESRLIAIREALLPYGFTNYRVNINGPSPASGLTRRYGASRMTDGGSVEWVTP